MSRQIVAVGFIMFGLAVGVPSFLGGGARQESTELDALAQGSPQTTWSDTIATPEKQFLIAQTGTGAEWSKRPVFGPIGPAAGGETSQRSKEIPLDDVVIIDPYASPSPSASTPGKQPPPSPSPSSARAPRAPNDTVKPCPADKPLGGRIEVEYKADSVMCVGTIRVVLRFPLVDSAPGTAPWPARLWDGFKASEVNYDVSTEGCTGQPTNEETCKAPGGRKTGKVSLKADGYLHFYPVKPRLMFLLPDEIHTAFTVPITCAPGGGSVWSVGLAGGDIRPRTSGDDKDQPFVALVDPTACQDYRSCGHETQRYAVIPFSGHSVWNPPFNTRESFRQTKTTWNICCGCGVSTRDCRDIHALDQLQAQVRQAVLKALSEHHINLSAQQRTFVENRVWECLQDQCETPTITFMIPLLDASVLVIGFVSVPCLADGAGEVDVDLQVFELKTAPNGKKFPDRSLKRVQTHSDYNEKGVDQAIKSAFDEANLPHYKKPGSTS